MREGLTLNAPYPSCQANGTPDSFIHLDELAFKSQTTFDRFIFGVSAMSKCK